MRTLGKHGYHQFGLRRLLVGTALVAVPLSIFPAFGRPGTIVAIVIAVCCFFIALLAKTYQVWAIGRLLVGGFIGWFFGLLLAPGYRTIEDAQVVILFTIVGLVAGAVWAFPAYCEYKPRSSGHDARGAAENVGSHELESNITMD